MIVFPHSKLLVGLLANLIANLLSLGLAEIARGGNFHSVNQYPAR
jgi:hypothetical protein